MRRLLAGWALSGMVLAACGGGAGPDAPDILYGEDICDRCRMVISEQRHAAGARIDGREHRFDDPGCLREFLEAEATLERGELWVHDEAGVWIPAGEAWFVQDPEGGTPMASGILAFGSAEAAAGAGQRYGSEPRRWASLAAAGAAERQGTAAAGTSAATVRP